MSEASRRNFLSLAGVGVAAAGVAAVAPAVARATPGAAATKAPALGLPAGAEGAMAAFVRDVRTGEVAIMVEGREVVVTDRELVARLAHTVAGTGL